VQRAESGSSGTKNSADVPDSPVKDGPKKAAGAPAVNLGLSIDSNSYDPGAENVVKIPFKELRDLGMLTPPFRAVLLPKSIERLSVPC